MLIVIVVVVRIIVKINKRKLQRANLSLTSQRLLQLYNCLEPHIKITDDEHNDNYYKREAILVNAKMYLLSNMEYFSKYNCYENFTETNLCDKKILHVTFFHLVI